MKMKRSPYVAEVIISLSYHFQHHGDNELERACCREETTATSILAEGMGPYKPS